MKKKLGNKNIVVGLNTGLIVALLLLLIYGTKQIPDIPHKNEKPKYEIKKQILPDTIKATSDPNFARYLALANTRQK